MNVWDIVIIILVVAVVVFAIIKIAHDKKKGKTCCGNCAECSGCVYK
ncbi:MAG: FeoB-associated Cys-rich membrane protein [Clostridia bacterium]|nr:FeoB-associated Cys-rich membrane protein [Clostridia bacterium]